MSNCAEHEKRFITAGPDQSIRPLVSVKLKKKGNSRYNVSHLFLNIFEAVRDILVLIEYAKSHLFSCIDSYLVRLDA